jgi:hypothetical protein
VYNSETLCVEESMQVKFDDKEPGSKTPEQDESVSEIQVLEDTPEPDQIAKSEDGTEAEPTSEAQDEVASDEAQDGSQQADQSKNTFKYKSSSPEDQIIGNKESPRRTRSYFR